MKRNTYLLTLAAASVLTQNGLGQAASDPKLIYSCDERHENLQTKQVFNRDFLRIHQAVSEDGQDVIRVTYKFFNENAIYLLKYSLLSLIDLEKTPCNPAEDFCADYPPSQLDEGLVSQIKASPKAYEFSNVDSAHPVTITTEYPAEICDKRLSTATSLPQLLLNCSDAANGPGIITDTSTLPTQEIKIWQDGLSAPITWHNSQFRSFSVITAVYEWAADTGGSSEIVELSGRFLLVGLDKNAFLKKLSNPESSVHDPDLVASVQAKEFYTESILLPELNKFKLGTSETTSFSMEVSVNEDGTHVTSEKEEVSAITTTECKVH